MKFEIKHRWNGSVLFAAELECGDDESYSIKLGLAVKAAIAAKADLSWADLSKANLSWADLSEADLSWANLSKADLSEANLSEANLSEADLSWADLSKADLSWANLSKADLSWANLSKANLSKANLSKANLSEANLSEANLSEANLSEANLSEANLRYIKHDVWGILLNAIAEVPALRQAVVEGCVDGSCYEGACACLCGTIANVRGCKVGDLNGITPNSSSMAELFFMGIKEGDTPETNPASKLVLEWIDEFLALLSKQQIKA